MHSAAGNDGCKTLTLHQLAWVTVGFAPQIDATGSLPAKTTADSLTQVWLQCSNWPTLTCSNGPTSKLYRKRSITVKSSRFKSSVGAA